MDVTKNIANEPLADVSAHEKKIFPAPFQHFTDEPRVDKKSVHTRTSLAPFNPSCLHAQNVAMVLLNLTSDDVLFDLGFGDGRFLMTAAEKHLLLRCVGIEMDPVHAQRAKEAVEVALENIIGRIDIREGDVMGAFDLVGIANVSNGGAKLL
mmetsp:Transcript_11842/g.18332  ORF Transcript_11842/g.18332 Transcript_11842/m.18332 type:complete len:152 (+) Transcript_11842:220-675(+)